MNAPVQRLIAPETLARLANLELLARTVVEGTLHGLHRSARFGFSQEFAEYRAYVPGDDPRFIDWNVLARTDRTFVKRFFGDTNARLMIAIDASGSMAALDGAGAPQRGVSKLAYARFVAAALVYLAMRQHDAVGLAVFSADVQELHPPGGARAAQRLYHVLDRLSAAGTTDWTRLLDVLGERLQKRCLMVLISDLYADAALLGRGLRALRAGGHDLLVIQILDPAEREPSLAPGTTVEDVETRLLLEVDSDDLRRAYPARLAAHVQGLQRAVMSAGGHYLRMDTDQPLDRLLAEYLRFRERHP